MLPRVVLRLERGRFRLDRDEGRACSRPSPKPARSDVPRNSERRFHSRTSQRASSAAMPTYRTMVRAQPAASAGQNAKPRLRSAGISRNIGCEGSPYQKVSWAYCAMRSASPVSRHNQIMLSTVMRGSAEISAPIPGLRRATSETATMMIAERIAFRIR